MNGVSGEQRLRPFPALDPEPPSRITWKNMRWPALGCVVAAAVVTVVLLTWPSSSPHTRLSAGFTGSNGVIVFERQPSGTLGTAAPDGGHQVMLTKIGGLQGTDLPLASSDGRYLVNQEGQLVTMGAAGPASVTTLALPAAAQGSGFSWLDDSFADGGKYVEATECYGQGQGPSGPTQAWVADLLPTAGGQDHVLGTVTDSAGDPASAGAFEALPVSASAATSGTECYGIQPVADKAIELHQPGQAPRVIVTAADLGRALGVPPGTPLELSGLLPSPDGSLLAVDVLVGTPLTPAEVTAARRDAVVLTRAGKVTADIRLPARSGMDRWSSDGRQIAFGEVSGATSSVMIWTAGAATRTIALPGRHDLYCDQLLWSPDDRQLIYSAAVSEKGLTQADRLQHGWTVVDLRSGKAHDVTAPGQPVVWLPPSGGTR